MGKKWCFQCGTEILEATDCRLIPLDRPYINLYFHIKCFKEVGGYDNMGVFCSQNVKKVYPYIERLGKESTHSGRKKPIEGTTKELSTASG